MTDIPANHIHETLKSLVKKGLVKVEGGRGHKTYRLSESTESVRSEPCESPETGLMKVPKQDEVKSQVGTKLSPKMGLSHEGYIISTKEREKDSTVLSLTDKTGGNGKKPKAPVQELFAAYYAAYDRRYHRKPIITKGKDAAFFNSLLAEHDVEYWTKILDTFLESNDSWAVKKAHDLVAFKSMLNALINDYESIQKDKADLEETVRRTDEWIAGNV